MRDYSKRYYIELDVTFMTQAEVEELIAEAVESSLDTCKTSTLNTIILKFDRNPVSILAKYNQHVVRNKKRGVFRDEIGHFALADGESKPVLTFKVDRQ